MIKDENDQKNVDVETNSSDSVKLKHSAALKTNKLNVKTEYQDQPEDELFDLEFTAKIDEKNMSMGLIENFISHSVFGNEVYTSNVEDSEANEANQGQLPRGEDEKRRGKLKIKKQYMCSECRKTFTKKYSLNRHIVIHSNERMYVCETCNKSFGEKHHLVEHKRIHSGEKPYICDVCNTAFAHKSTLCRHKLIHTGEKPYSCNSCEKSFNKKSTLDRHKLVHTGEKPYVCNVCNNQYRHKQSLDQHKLNHHKT